MLPTEDKLIKITKHKKKSNSLRNSRHTKQQKLDARNSRSRLILKDNNIKTFIIFKEINE